MRAADMRLMFDYSYWATGLVLEAAARLSAAQFSAPATIAPLGLRETLLHMLDTELALRTRLQGDTAQPAGAALTDADAPDAAALAARWQADERAMRAYLATLSDADLDAPVDLGRSGPLPLWYPLYHLLNHSSQHRAEAAILLTHAGQSPGDLDFARFVRERGA
jgi:uncharacterized damage-inducible protein DinB